MTIKSLLLFTFIYFFLSCSKDNNGGVSNTTKDYLIGKNRYVVKVDEDNREYFVHVPVNYSGNISMPVVFMLHGTSGNGEEFYNNSGWKEVGDVENIITVYPSSWRYCINTDGQQKTTTKWNSLPGDWSFCAGEKPRDDVKFFKSIISELAIKFNIDNKRIYLVGFSSGSQMAGKCTVEMSDTFAAIVESAGSLYSNNPDNPGLTPLRKLPIFFQKGNQDYGPGNTGPTAPMKSLATLLTDPSATLLNGNLYAIAQTNIHTFDLKSNFTITGDTSSIVTASYQSVSGNDQNVFYISLIKGLKHAYPNGTNHPYKAAETNWKWLQQYSL